MCMCTLMHRHVCKTAYMDTYILCIYRMNDVYMQHTQSMAVQTQRCIHTKAHISALIFTDLHIFTLRCVHTLAVHIPTFLWAFAGSPIYLPRTGRESTGRTLVPTV